ncbi:MAG: PEP-CTERM sorting domain-containing protein [Lentisphaeria bacterium]|nr:PEP-CTERM sorting domain-containing protein [Lentisphaeria bacterium]
MTGYVASPLTGIDEMLVAHFADATGVWTGWHRHRTSGGAPDTLLIETVNGAPNPDLPGPGVIVGSAFDSQENGGAMLQWAIPNGELLGVDLLGGVWAVTYDINDSFGGTFDITETLVPEPASALLFGLFGLLALRRKRGR